MKYVQIMAWLQNTVILILKLILLLYIANCETPQKFLQWLVITLSLKVWKKILGMTTMALKEEITIFHRKFKEFNSSIDI